MSALRLDRHELDVRLADVEHCDSFRSGQRARRSVVRAAHPARPYSIAKTIVTFAEVRDGKVFVLPMGEAIRIRTGETGESAI